MRTFDTKCTECIWACEMPVEITLDNWNPRATRYRKETFCYGPKWCRWHREGFRRFWRWKSRRPPGRPPIPEELRAVIQQMAAENTRWGEKRIADENFS